MKDTISKISELLGKQPEGFNRLLLSDLEARNVWKKQVNHIFHYTPKWDYLKGIINEGFYPSYSEEVFSENEKIYIAMVSFCNIAIAQTNDYLRYGKFGIGLSIEWALINNINPVHYFHDQSIFKKLYNQVSGLILNNLEELKAVEGIDEIYSLNRMMFKLIKNMSVDFDGLLINAYQEREWRYLPHIDALEKDKNPDILIEYEHQHDALILNRKNDQKLFEPLKFDLSDIKYLLVPDDQYRNQLVDCLSNKFGAKSLKEHLTSGLLILTSEQLALDF
ncbi:MAG: abortive infection system antitoxin AbiGi family protein [Cyclobacteriaceae bacterium]